MYQHPELGRSVCTGSINFQHYTTAPCRTRRKHNWTVGRHHYLLIVHGLLCIQHVTCSAGLWSAKLFWSRRYATYNLCDSGNDDGAWARRLVNRSTDCTTQSAVGFFSTVASTISMRNGFGGSAEAVDAWDRTNTLTAKNLNGFNLLVGLNPS